MSSASAKEVWGTIARAIADISTDVPTCRDAGMSASVEDLITHSFIIFSTSRQLELWNITHREVTGWNATQVHSQLSLSVSGTSLVHMLYLPLATSLLLQWHKSHTVKPVFKDQCCERPPVLKDHISLAEHNTFQCNWTYHQRPPDLRDQIVYAQ